MKPKVARSAWMTKRSHSGTTRAPPCHPSTRQLSRPSPSSCAASTNDAPKGEPHTPRAGCASFHADAPRAAVTEHTVGTLRCSSRVMTADWLATKQPRFQCAPVVARLSLGFEVAAVRALVPVLGILVAAPRAPVMAHQRAGVRRLRAKPPTYADRRQPPQDGRSAEELDAADTERTPCCEFARRGLGFESRHLHHYL